MLHSPVHSKYPVQAIYARFLKAFQLGQGHLYYAKHIPVGVVTWARVSSYWHEKLIYSLGIIDEILMILKKTFS